ncbi:MAG: DUF5615 family PIN-like protein [Saprospiraceae bacterium]|jgi:predicted nuclease of predicted toxin-antitoxin system|nr:DUF5615 family PIN-like protein [Saprospiraceae bacterium]
MKFLIDNAISHFVAEELTKLGHDAIHVRDIGIQHAKDEVIFNAAFDSNRTIITADTDFSFLLSVWRKNKPSVITFRKGAESNPFEQVALLKLNLSNDVFDAIENESIIIIEPFRMRIRPLPLG